MARRWNKHETMCITKIFYASSNTLWNLYVFIDGYYNKLAMMHRLSTDPGDRR